MDLHRNLIGVNAPEGFVINPRTGRPVRADARIGRAVIAANDRALEIAGLRVPRGALRDQRPSRAIAGQVIVDYARFGRPRPAGAYRVQEYRTPAARTQTLAQFAQTIIAASSEVENLRGVVVRFVDEVGNIIRRTLHPTNAVSLINELDALQRTGVRAPESGSDPIHESFIIDTSGFEIGSVTFPAGAALKLTGVSKGAGRKHPHFKLTDFSGKARDGDCLFAVLRAVAKGHGLAVPKERNNSIRVELGIPPGPIEATHGNIEALAVKFGLRVRVITGMVAAPDSERVFDDSPARLTGRNLCTGPAPSPNVIAVGGAENAPDCDVYLAENHYEFISRVLEPIPVCPITGDIIEADDRRTSAAIQRRVAQQGRTWYAQRKAPAEPKRRDYTERIIVFDYETTCDHLGTLEPYALGYLVLDPADGDDFAARAGEVAQIIRRRGENRYAVTAPLLDELANAAPDVRYTLVSFNGARFDHYLLAQAANNRGVLSSVFATTSGGIRALTIGRHQTLDLAKLAPAMSLASACRGFRTSPSKMDGFSHVDVQREANAGRLYEWLDENRGQLAEYLGRDVLSTASLFVKLTKTLTAITGKPCYGDGAIGTIGGHAWALMSEKCSLPERVSTHEIDKTIRSAIVGGRVQCYGTERRIEEKRLHMVDFASLYPTAMAAVDKADSVFPADELWGVYPSGRENSEPTHVKTWTQGEVGIYRTTIHEQPPGLPNVLPRRGETLEWDYRGEFECWATHIDLALITRHGGRVTVHEGYTWPVHRKGLFRPFIAELAAGKDEQDRLAAANNPEANPALRMVLKLLMNSASGKCCQNNYDDVVELATGSSAQLAVENKMDRTKPITYVPLGGETCIIIGKKIDEKIYKKTAKPSILAVLIYAYSRALVWRTLCQHNVIYSDTDSGLFRPADYKRLREQFPQLDPTGRAKQLGDLEEELHDHARAVAFTLAPKDYAVFLFDEGGTVPRADSKIRLKGVNQRCDRLIISEEVAEELGEASTNELFDAFHERSLARSKPLADITTAFEFYERRAAGETTRVLSSQLVRSFRNPDSPLELTQRFLVKNL